MVLPYYDCLESEGVDELKVEREDLKVCYGGAEHPLRVWSGRVGEIRVYFLDPQHPAKFFQRGCFYGCDDDVDRAL